MYYSSFKSNNLLHIFNSNMLRKVNLYGTSKYVVNTIVHNNIGNGLRSNITIYDEKTNTIVVAFQSIEEYSNWWITTYGNSEAGLDEKYVIITISRE